MGNAVSKDAFFVEESEEVNERYLRLLHLEGEVPIAELYVSDYKDSPPASSFTWGIVDGTGMFRIDISPNFVEFIGIFPLRPIMVCRTMKVWGANF